jgi:multisubunit Na+/H+ antiporter MnhG subunit
MVAILKVFLMLAAGFGGLVLRSVLASVVFFLRMPAYAHSTRRARHHSRR